MAELGRPAVSVVIPARNEAENLAELLPEIAAAAGELAYEVVIADDGSTDGTAAMVLRMAAQGLPVRRVEHRRSLGQSAALYTGVMAARGDLVLTLDGDGQNDPRPLKDFIQRFADRRIGLVAGQRVGRKATFAKAFGSRIANRIRRAFLHDDTRDTGCGIKAFRREAFVKLPYFQTMHRFLPALFRADGWEVAHLDVVDRPRRHGKSNYGIIDRLMVGIPDLFGVRWLVRRRMKSPFRLEEEAR